MIHQNLRLRFFYLSVVMAAMAVLTSSPSSADEVIIITHKDVCMDTLTRNQIRKIFLGKISMWSDKSLIRFVLIPDEEIHKKFVRNYTRKTEEQFWAWWKRKLFAGVGWVPIQFGSEAEVVEYVGNTPGAMGYVSSKEILNENVKILNVIDDDEKGKK